MADINQATPPALNSLIIKGGRVETLRIDRNYNFKILIKSIKV